MIQVIVEKSAAEGLPEGWIKKLVISNRSGRKRRDPVCTLFVSFSIFSYMETPLLTFPFCSSSLTLKVSISSHPSELHHVMLRLAILGIMHASSRKAILKMMIPEMARTLSVTYSLLLYCIVEWLIL